MNLNFCLVFFTLITFSCIISALKCYKCQDSNADGHFFCSSLDNLNSWKIVECSGSCVHNSGNRFVIQFICGKGEYCQISEHFLKSTEYYMKIDDCRSETNF